MSFIKTVMQALQADELSKAENAKKKIPQKAAPSENGTQINSSPNDPGQGPTPVTQKPPAKQGKAGDVDRGKGEGKDLNGLPQKHDVGAAGTGDEVGEDKDLNGQPMINPPGMEGGEGEDGDPVVGDEQGDSLHPVGEDEEADEQILQNGNASDEDSFAEPSTDQQNLEYVKMSQHDGGKQFWYRDPATGKIIEGDNAPEGHPDYDASGMLQSLIQRIEQLEQAVGVPNPEMNGMGQPPQDGQDQGMGQDGMGQDQGDMDDMGMGDEDDGDLDDMFGDDDDDADENVTAGEGQDQGMNDMDQQNSMSSKPGMDPSKKPPQQNAQKPPQYGKPQPKGQQAAPQKQAQQKPAAKPNPGMKQKLKKALKAKYPESSDEYIDKILEKSFTKLEKAGGDNANNAQTGFDDTSSYGPGSEGMDESSIGQGGDIMKAGGMTPPTPPPPPTTGAQSAQDSMRQAFHFGKSDSNPDESADATLGEKIEKLVEAHMMANKEAEKKEGHLMMKTDTPPPPPPPAKPSPTPSSGAQSFSAGMQSASGMGHTLSRFGLSEEEPKTNLEKADDQLVKPMEPVANAPMSKSKPRFERMWMVSKVEMPESLDKPEELKKAQEGMKKLLKFITNQGKSEADATHIVNRAVIEKYDLLNKGSKYFANYNAWVGGETINTTYETTIENMEVLKKSDADRRFAVREYLEESEVLVIEKSNGDSNARIKAEMTHDAPVWKEFTEYKEPIVKSVDPRTIQRSEKYNDMWSIPKYQETKQPYKDSSVLVKSDINERIAAEALEKSKDSNFKGRYPEFNEELEKSKHAPKTDAELRNEEADKRIWGNKDGNKK